MDILENKQIKLRALEPEDIDLIYNWENNSDIWRFSNTLTPFSRHILTEYIANAHLDIYTQKQLRLMIVSKENNKTVGTIDLFDFDPFHLRAGIGILIANTKDRRKSFATYALDVVKKYAFDHLLLHQLYCNISIDNKISIHLFQQAGFEITGTKKHWLKTAKGWKDEYCLQLINPELNDRI